MWVTWHIVPVLQCQAKSPGWKNTLENALQSEGQLDWEADFCFWPSRGPTLCTWAGKAWDSCRRLSAMCLCLSGFLLAQRG